MLDRFNLEASLPASEISRAKTWYREMLDLKPVEETPDGGAFYETGGSRFLVYPSTFAGTNKATAAAWGVDDIDEVVTQLKSRGVTFQELDMGEIKTVNSIATTPDGLKAAWFKDSEDNILGLFQNP